MEGPGRHRRHRRVRETAARRYEAGEVSPEDPAPEVGGVLLDSDVIIEILRGRQPTLGRARALARKGVRGYCSAVSYAEVFRGVRAGEEVLTETFFAGRGEVVIDAAMGRRAGSYLALYSRSHAVEVADALIAAAATVTGLRLWTLNRRHYPMPDVRFYDPES